MKNEIEIIYQRDVELLENLFKKNSIQINQLLELLKKSVEILEKK